jgi:predicted DNA-binding transcriptional regulator YafY
VFLFFQTIDKNHSFQTMPNTKLAFFRYLLIDQMLRNRFKKYPTKEELLEACNEKFGVESASTIEKDLNAMRLEFDAPIAYNKKYKGYEYTDKSYKFLSINLSDDNLLALGFVETLLQEFRNLPMFDEFSDAVDKVLDGVEITRSFRDNVRNFKQFIQIDKSPYRKGSELLSQLMKLTTSETVFEFSYKKFNADKPKTYTIHPYLLKEYRNIWYLIGYVAQYQEVRTFGIDRIEEILSLDTQYIKPEKVNFDADNFYKHCLGVTALNTKPEKIILQFSAATGNYIKLQPLHSSQTIVKDDEQELIVRLELVINYELRMLILSYGSEVKVLAPESLADEVKNYLQSALEHYK